jgi:FkbH-like protein
VTPRSTGVAADVERHLRAGDECRRARDLDGALDAYAKAAGLTELPTAEVCARMARAHEDAGDRTTARAWALRVLEGGDDFASWDAASRVVERVGVAPEVVRRRVRIGLLGTYTTAYLARLLRLVGAARGIDIECYEGGYDQLSQEVLDPASGLAQFAPDVIVFAVDARAAGLPEWSDTPDADVETACNSWRALWKHVGELGAAVIQHNFVVPPEAAIGHLDSQLRGTRYHMLAALNARMASEDPATVHVVDCERVAGRFGKDAWCDPLWWDRAKLGVSLPASPVLARHTAAVLSGYLGLGRKCLVLDLDNTCWGGVIGEDGIAGIQLGGDAAGDAYVAFQERVLALKRRGVLLAACSRNDPHVAREPFELHADMRLGLDDFAMFVANWDSKVDNIKHIALELGIGLDALAYADDNPVERQEVRQFLPMVDVLAMPDQPSLYARALSDYVWFETASYTTEDAHRTEQYRARQEVGALERSAESIDDFYRGLRMESVVSPITEADLLRVAQLVGKTNQFNLTGRRRDAGALETLMNDAANLHLTLRLRDRFTDHGLVGVLIGHVDADAVDIDTWLLSCRVIGRTAERTMLGALSAEARRRGCTTLRGMYIPTTNNGLVRDLYPSLGFELLEDDDGTTTWSRAIDDDVINGSPFIDTEVDRGAA